MMPGGTEPIHGAVEHVRNDRKRMPVRGYDMSKRPNGPFGRQSPHYVRISIDIRSIVIINELVMERLGKNQPRQAAEQQRNSDNWPRVTSISRSSLHFRRKGYRISRLEKSKIFAATESYDHCIHIIGTRKFTDGRVVWRYRIPSPSKVLSLTLRYCSPRQIAKLS